MLATLPKSKIQTQVPSIKKSFFYNILFLLSNILFPLVTFAYVSRILGPEGYGKAQFIFVFAQYFVIIAAIGIPVYGVREIAKVRNNTSLLSKLFSELLFINILTTILLLAVYLVIIFSVHWFQHDLRLYLLGALLVFAGFSTLDWFYNGVEQFRFLYIRSITVKALALIALFILVKSKDDLVYYLLILIFSIIGNNIWNLLKIRKLITFRFKQLNLIQHLPILLTLFGTLVSISIYTFLDTVLLGFLADETSVGFYSAALKINKIAIPLVFALGTVLIPKITQSIANNDTHQLQKLIDKSFSYIVILGIPISIGLFVFASEFIFALSGTEFANATLTMKITAPLAIIIGLGHLFGFQLLIPAGLEKKYLTATIAGMLISVSLNLLLISSLKDKGTAIATVVGEVVVTIIAFYYVSKKIQLVFNWALALKSIAASLIFFPIAYLLRMYEINSIISLMIAICCSAFFYFAIQIFIFKEIKIPKH